MFKKIRTHLTVTALVAAAATCAYAQTYPTKPIYLYIPFAAGGPTDTLGRNLAQAMAKPLKQQMIVENVVGAGGTIAVARAAKAAPDGYTVLLHHRHVHRAGAVPQAPVRSAQGLRVHRRGGRRADDVDCARQLPRRKLQGVPRLHQGEQGQAHLRQRRPRRGLASVRAAVHERDPDRFHRPCPTRAPARR